MLNHCYPILIYLIPIGNGAQDWKGREDGGRARDGSVWGAYLEETAAGQGPPGHTEVQGPWCGQGMDQTADFKEGAKKMRHSALLSIFSYF